MSENTQTTSIVKAEKFVQVVESAQSALIKNQVSVQKATEFGQSLLDTIEAEGMSEDMDKACNDYLVKARKTDVLLKERRTPVTQLFTVVTKEFTGLESQLSKTNKNSIPAKIQVIRDEYAKQKAQEQRQREIEAQRKLNIEKEKAEVGASIDIALAKHFNNYMVSSQNELTTLFNGLTLDNFDTQSALILNFSCEMSMEVYNGFSHNVLLTYISKEDLGSLISQAKNTKFQHYNDLFTTKVNEYRQELVDKIPSKKTELEEIAEAARIEAEKAAEAERLRIEAEKATASEEEKRKAQEATQESERLRLEAEETERLRKEREQADADKLAQEAKELEEKEVSEAEAKKQESEMESLFNATEETVQPASSTQVRAGFTITISHPAGWVQVFQLWFEQEGKNLGVDAIGRKSLNSMKGFCEKHAHKTGEKITSQYVKYEESFKTVARS